MKTSRLLEIIREEIVSILQEVATIDTTKDPKRLTPDEKEVAIKTARTSTKDMTLGTSKNPVEFIEEDLLNEAPIYSVEDMAGFQSTLNKFKEEGVSKSKALNLLLTKLEDEGEVDTNQLSKDLGVDTATFNNLETRKFLNRPKDQFYSDKKGEELIDFSPYLAVVNKPKGRKAGAVAGEKPEAKPTVTPTTKPTAAKSTPTAQSTPTIKPTVAPTKPAPTKPTAEPKAKESPEEKANKAASLNKGVDKKADMKDKLLKDKREAEERMKELVKLIKTAEGDKRAALMKDLKQANADKLKADSDIARLFPI